ncbi:MAG: HupE/UreJ family protein [Minicystis sp.]
MKPLLVLAAILVALFAAPPARAHGTRSVTINLTEVEPGKAIARVRASRPGDTVRVRFEEPCRVEPAGEDAALSVTCPGSLAGATIAVDGLGPIVNEAIVAASFTDGAHLSRVLTVDEPSLTLPSRATGIGAAKSYVRLGIEHILTGYDHLLFLLSLVLLLRRPRAVIWAETAFTVSHSLSFSAAALGLVHVSAPAAEAAIALSLVLVALDIGRADRAPSSAHGAGIAFVFGLVHGLGFAGGLAEVGIPDHAVAAALLGFAGGVEIGQVAFLAVLLGVMHLARRRPVAARVEAAAALIIGGVASYWLLERTIACVATRA